MRVLIVDTETSGLSYDEGARVIEVAACLYDTRHASPIESFSCLLKHHENQAEPINRIPAAMLSEVTEDPAWSWNRFCWLSSTAECFVAHNASFDQGFVTKSIAETMLSEISTKAWSRNIPWVDTIGDVIWPGARESRSLTSLALSLGLGVASAHRASADVDLLARCLTRANEVMRFDWLRTKSEPLPAFGDFLEPMIRRGMRPKSLFYSLAPFDQKHIVKAHGFQWDEPKHGKNWFRYLPPEDAEGLPFRVRMVTP